MAITIGRGFGISYGGEHLGDLILRNVTNEDGRTAYFLFRRDGLPDALFELGKRESRQIIPEQRHPHRISLYVIVERITQEGPLTDAKVKLDFQGDKLYRVQQRDYLPRS
jgi:hypothetical protein